MTRRADLPRGLGSVFGVGMARASGASPDRLRAGDLSAPFSGARAVDRPVDLQALCGAYLPVAPPMFAFSHVTAALLYGMPLPRRLEVQSALDIVSPGRAVRRRGIRGHASADIVPRMLGPLPVVEPELAWLQLAAALTLDELVVAGDHLVRRKRPLSTPKKMADAVAGATGQRNVTRAQRALLDIRAGTDSPPESRVRLILIRAGLPEPVVGHEVTHDGYWVGTPDLAYPEHRIAIEYQGDGHRERTVFEDDIDRLERFHAADWFVIQVTARQLRGPAHLVSRVDFALRSRAPR